ncbi:putative transmembrane protein [Gregarina niphandrodes]|uniref:Transmembrane protein n=1 Tax=Gregarina niphandrodes TaxID=110365 RepID=A0A023BAA5_GRENI|nr:putative transmembrane protein [Gregarina niphandrodes]EZG78147.1 putative transmembrane protein [Gregarina niphandrodes]|eukprot:XP_011129461.1 putative transmembrane protein [Gregarina niphandrodes]
MKGKKKHACCCLPLAVAGVGISVILIIFNVATFLQQLEYVLDMDEKSASAIVTLIFTGLPVLCACFSLFGIMFKKAGLVNLAVSCIMPSVVLYIVAIITLWIGIMQHKDEVIESSNTLGWISVHGDNANYIVGAIATAEAVIVIALLCYCGDIFKSCANMIARKQNPWKIKQDATNQRGKRVVEEDDDDDSSSV